MKIKLQNNNGQLKEKKRPNDNLLFYCIMNAKN